MKRLFAAIDYTPEPWLGLLTRKLQASMSKMDRTNWVDNSLYHITLKFIGETMEYKIPRICDIISQSVNNIPPFDIQLDKINAFGSTYHPRVLMISTMAHPYMETIHNYINDQLPALGIKKDYGNFVPHLTLARINQLDDKKMFWNAVNKYQITEPHYIKVNKIILYESILSRGYQPKYVPLHTFELR